MNARQLEKLGVPPECVKSAVLALQSASEAGQLRSLNVKQFIKDILAQPSQHTADPHFGAFAAELLTAEAPEPPREPIAYQTWGAGGIDPASHIQMRQACQLPMAVAGALMP